VRLVVTVLVLSLVGCSGVPSLDAGVDPPDAAIPEVDAGPQPLDAGTDAGTPEDAGNADAGTEDAGVDAGPGDPCATNNGGCHSLTQCSSTGTQVTCSACPSGYTGDGTTGCVDVDECATIPDAGCSASQFCANTPGTFRCAERPVGTVLFDPQDTAAVGDLNTTSQLKPCPRDQVGIGYSFGANNFNKITSADPICSPLTLTGSPDAGFIITTTLPGAVVLDDRVCPANEVVTSVAVASGMDLQSLTVNCAPLSVQLGASGLVITTGSSHALTRYPVASSPAPNGGVACPANTVGAGATVYGGQYLFAFGMRCVRPAMRYDVPSISFGATTDTPIIGITTATNTTYRDVCPAGQVVTGVELESQWRSFAVECGTPVFDLPPRVAVSPADALGFQGQLAPRFASRCPWNAALTHVEFFTQGTYILGGLGLACATFTASTTPGWGLTVDASMVAVPAPPYPGMPKATTCAAGQVAVGVRYTFSTQSNGYRTLSHVGLVCAAPQVP
jgi:hypothetical protein